jgi:hypothetical protein
MTKLSKGIQALAAAKKISGPKMKKLQKVVSDARDLQFEKETLEARLAVIAAALTQTFTVTLPDLMDQAGVDTIGLPAVGNHSALDAKLVPFYAAGIAASWPSEKREQAFKWLSDHGHATLIKTSVTIDFDRTDRDKAVKFAKTNGKLSPKIIENVHAGTLKAWLKEQVEEEHVMPPLDIIGGTVGRVVKLKERK